MIKYEKLPYSLILDNIQFNPLLKCGSYKLCPLFGYL